MLGELRGTDGTELNVKSFGAVGDGVTDDTAALNYALRTPRGIFIPEGTYLIDQLGGQLKTGLRFHENAWLKRKNNNINEDGFIRNMARLTIKNSVYLINPGVDGNGVNQPDLDPENPTYPYDQQFSAGIKLLADGVFIPDTIAENARVKDPTGDGVYFGETTAGGGYGTILVKNPIATDRAGYLRRDICVASNHNKFLVIGGDADVEVEVDKPKSNEYLNESEIRDLRCPFGLDINTRSVRADGSHPRCVIENVTVGYRAADSIINKRFNLTFVDADVRNVTALFDSRAYAYGSFRLKSCTFLASENWRSGNPAMFDEYTGTTSQFELEDTTFGAHPDAIANGLTHFVKTDILNIPAA